MDKACVEGVDPPRLLYAHVLQLPVLRGALHIGPEFFGKPTGPENPECKPEDDTRRTDNFAAVHHVVKRFRGEGMDGEKGGAKNRQLVGVAGNQPEKPVNQCDQEKEPRERLGLEDDRIGAGTYLVIERESRGKERLISSLFR